MSELEWSPGVAAEVREEIKEKSGSRLDACRKLEKAAIARTQPWTGRDGYEDGPESVADELISLEWARGTKTFRAVDVLCRAGYGEQGAMLNRSLFEGMAVAHWIHGHPAEAAERFEEAKRMNRHLAAKLTEELEWHEDVDSTALSDATLEGDELEEFQRKFGDEGQRMWTGPGTLRKLLRTIENQWGETGRKQLWKFFKLVNRDNNQLLHSSVLGLTRAFGGHVEGGGTVWIGPSLQHIDQALFGAFWTYGQLLTLVADRFELDDAEGLKAELDEWMRDFSETKF